MLEDGLPEFRAFFLYSLVAAAGLDGLLLHFLELRPQELRQFPKQACVGLPVRHHAHNPLGVEPPQVMDGACDVLGVAEQVVLALRHVIPLRRLRVFPHLLAAHPRGLGDVADFHSLPGVHGRHLLPLRLLSVRRRPGLAPGELAYRAEHPPVVPAGRLGLRPGLRRLAYEGGELLLQVGVSGVREVLHDVELVGDVPHEGAFPAGRGVLLRYQAVQLPYGGDVALPPVAGDFLQVRVEQQPGGHLRHVAGVDELQRDARLLVHDDRAVAVPLALGEVVDAHHLDAAPGGGRAQPAEQAGGAGVGAGLDAHRPDQFGTRDGGHLQAAGAYEVVAGVRPAPVQGERLARLREGPGLATLAHAAVAVLPHHDAHVTAAAGE